MITIDQERPQDRVEIEALLDAAFGPERSQKSSYKLRAQVSPLANLSTVIRAEGHVAATVRYTPVHVAGHFMATKSNALLLGPLAVSPLMQSAGLGSALVQHTLEKVDELRHERVFLVGDIKYYQRFGFQPVRPRHISMPCGSDAGRLLVRSKGDVQNLPLWGELRAGWQLETPSTALQPA
jgi:predicted N-acetyltransferase YhbS